MKRFPQRLLPILAVIALALAVFFLWQRKSPPRLPAAPASLPSVPLSALADKPDWRKLERFQETITRTDFERLLTGVFTTGDAWQSHIAISDDAARIDAGEPEEPFILRFAKSPVPPQAKPVFWTPASALPPAPSTQPLAGLHIAIDPGHIGGDFARIEERRLEVPGSQPVLEGEMTLFVANLLKPKLMALGAEVSLIRSRNEPITPLRPESLAASAAETKATSGSGESIQRIAERLFYRTAEIRARAVLVNETIKPDLVLCLHFNAESWGDPQNPTLVPRTHMHLLVNGAYTDAEIRLADQRFAMLEKLLSGTFDEEAAIGRDVAEVFAARSGMPPYHYPPGAANVRDVNGNPYIWARNLLANRLYDCPVIFMEPYVMNSTIDHPRLAAGDYNGEREINGRIVRSIFREYADFLAEGLAKYYTETRRKAE